MTEAIADNQTKTFSKTGVTGALIAASGGFDLARTAILPMIQGTGNARIDWVALIAFFGGVLVALFRKYSDGKIPKVV